MKIIQRNSSDRNRLGRKCYRVHSFYTHDQLGVEVSEGKPVKSSYGMHIISQLIVQSIMTTVSTTSCSSGSCKFYVVFVVYTLFIALYAQWCWASSCINIRLSPTPTNTNIYKCNKYMSMKNRYISLLVWDGGCKHYIHFKLV